MSKISWKLIQLRMCLILDEQQPEEQASFRKSYYTIDHLHTSTINQLMEKRIEYQTEIHFAFLKISEKRLTQ